MIYTRSFLLTAVVVLLAAGTTWAQTSDPGTSWTGQDGGGRRDASNVQEAIDLLQAEGLGKTSAGRTGVEWKDFGISFGASILGAFNTELRVDPQKVPILGTRLRLEDDLGFDSSAQVFRIDAFYAFNRHHRIDVSWFDINRDSTAKTKQEIRWEDIVLPPTRIDLHFNTTIIKVAYRYNFLVRDDWELGAGLGIHWMDLDTGFRIRQKPADGEVVDIRSSENVKQGLPLPMIGIHGNFAPSDDWRIFASIEAFWAKLGEYSGRISDVRVGVDWMFTDWLGVGLYYNAFQLEVEADTSEWKGEAEYSYHGIVLALNLAF